MVNAQRTSFELSRQVEAGAEAFLQIAQHFAASVFTPTYENGVILPRSEADLDREQRAFTPVGNPRATVYGKLMLSLIKLGAEGEADMPNRNYADFNNLATRISDVQTGARGEHLRERLNGIAREYDGEPDSAEATCSGIMVAKSPTKNQHEIVLTVRDGSRFIKEHDLFMAFIKSMGRLKQKTALEHGFMPGIPFATISETSIDERDKYIQLLENELPKKLILGPILRPMVR